MKQRRGTDEAMVMSRRNVCCALIGVTLLTAVLLVERLEFQSHLNEINTRIDRISHLTDTTKQIDDRILAAEGSISPEGQLLRDVDWLNSKHSAGGSKKGVSPELKLTETELSPAIRATLSKKLDRVNSTHDYFHAGLATCAAVWILFLWRCFRRVSINSRHVMASEQKRVRELVTIDKATGLLNQESFKEQAEQLLGSAKGGASNVVIVMIDLDYFKPVNDVYGHEMGDKVLGHVGSVISKSFREGDIVARYAGDEFIVALKHDSERIDLVKRAQKLIARLSDPMKFDDVSIVIGASVGISNSPEHGDELDDLIRKAGIALYHAKHIGRGTAQCFTPAMTKNLNKTFQKKKTISEAIDDGQIVPFFQPIVNLEKACFAHFEVLARWEHPERGLLAPAEFLPQVIEYDLVNKMTLKLLEAVCKVGHQVGDDVSFAINVSARQVQDDWFVERLLDALEIHKFPSERIIVEIEESVLITDLEQARETIISLNENNIRVMLDDFGTGYSSLSYLAELPFDALKIDKSFVMNMVEREAMRKVVSSIISLGESFEMDIVAEGIEGIEHVRMLRDFGCKFGQGFLFSKPVSATELPDLLSGPPEGVHELNAFQRAG